MRIEELGIGNRILCEILFNLKTNFKAIFDTLERII